MSSDAAWHVLPWDSDFFGFKVASIEDPELDCEGLLSLIHCIRRQGVELVYWAARWPLPAEVALVVERCGGRLLDVKTTYVRAVDQVAAGTAECNMGYVVTSAESSDVEELSAIAVQSGEFSRFAIDSRIPRDCYEALYRLWMRRSLLRELADDVLVVRIAGQMVAAITVSAADDVGKIGLMGVAERLRRQGVGRTLMAAALRWFASHGCSHVEVVTQGHNRAACMLYAACGFAVSQRVAFHHLWLTPQKGVCA